MWLIPLVNDCHFGYITKLKWKTMPITSIFVVCKNFISPLLGVLFNGICPLLEQGEKFHFHLIPKNVGPDLPSC
jgi:hypothetical protein